MELESRESAALLASQQENARQRSQDALLREKIRKDYATFMKTLDQLSKEERKLKANQIATDTVSNKNSKYTFKRSRV